MSDQTKLPTNLIKAYEATNFHVKFEPDFILNVGKASEEVNALFKQNNVSSATFITAWNPYSKPLSEKDNQERNEQLRAELGRRSLKYIDGFGQDPAGQWAGEDSFLVLGISLEAAKKLGNQFEQNAIVWVDEDFVPKLILLR